MSNKKPEIDENIFARLLFIRKELKLSQTAFSEKIGIKQSTYNEFENGKREPSLPVIYAICYRFSIAESWLLTGEGGKWQEEKRATPVDTDLMEAVIAAVEEYLDQVDGHLKPAKKAQLVVALYDMFIADEVRTVDKAKVIQLVRLAA